MPQFAANLTLMFTERPFLDRFAAAAEAGFRAVEYLFPYEHSAEDVAARAQRRGPDPGAVQRPGRGLDGG